MAGSSTGNAYSKASRFPDDVYHYVNKTWNTTMQNEFLALFGSEELTDITLQICGRRYKCHKIILCASSVYFKAMFTSCFSEAGQSEVELRGISASAFYDVLQFIYGGKIRITLENAEDLLNIACMMQLEELKGACSTFLQSYLSVENCIDQIIFADKFAVDDLTEACVELVVTNFCKLMETGGFGHLPAEAVVRVLKNDKLPIKSEKEAALAVLDWIRINSEERTNQLNFVFSGVRLTELSPQFIKCSLMNNTLIQSSPELVGKLHVILDNAAYGFPLTKDIILTHPRVSTDIQHELVIFCESILDSGAVADWNFKLTRSASGKLKLRQMWRTTQCTRTNHGTTISIFNNGGALHSLADRQKVKAYFGTCASDNNLYVSGYVDGYSILQNPTPLTRFDPSQGAYFPCAPLPTKRKSHQLVAGHKGTIYVLGGYVYTEPEEDLNSQQQNQGTPHFKLRKQWCMNVIEYNIAMNKWSAVGGDRKLRLNVRPHYPCFFFGGKLFIITAHLDLIMFDCDSGESKEIRVTSNQGIKAVFQGNVSTATYKDTAILTSTNQSTTTFVILDLKQLLTLFETVNPGLSEETDLGDIALVYHPTVTIEGAVEFLGIVIFGGDLVAMVKAKNEDVYALSCVADDICYESQNRTVSWKKVHHFRTHHMKEEIKLKNVKRLRMHTLVTNIK